MKPNRNLTVGLVLLLGSVIGLVTMTGPRSSMAETMGNQGMGMMDGMMGERMPPGIDPAKLPVPQSEGARLIQYYCNQCHNLPAPGLHTSSEWPTVVARMNHRMQMMSGRGKMWMMRDIEAPSQQELDTLITYLQANALKVMEITEHPEMDSPAGIAFQQTCSRCHSLPDSGQHTADEWPTVVKRMTRNMTKMGMSVPDKTTLEEIVSFLQMHSGN
jgi:cytochrome c5